MCLCFLGKQQKQCLSVVIVAKTQVKKNCYEKDYYRQSQYNGCGTLGNIVYFCHNLVAGIGNIAHYGQIRNGISACHRFGDTDANLTPIANGDTIFVSFGKTIIE